jgi:hypothetical protein
MFDCRIAISPAGEKKQPEGLLRFRLKKYGNTKIRRYPPRTPAHSHGSCAIVLILCLCINFAKPRL